MRYILCFVGYVDYGFISGPFIQETNSFTHALLNLDSDIFKMDRMEVKKRTLLFYQLTITDSVEILRYDY